MSTSSQATWANSTDPELVERYLIGETEAFMEIVRRYRSMVYRLAMKITGNPEDAEDATQDAFLNLSTKLDRFQGRSALKTWIYRVAVNAALMVVRGGRRHQNHQELDTIGVREPRVGLVAHVPSGESMVPESRLLDAEALAVVRAAIDRLPETFRTVVVLADLEELSNREVAEVLDISVAAIKSRLHRARLLLRKELADYFEKRVDAMPSPTRRPTPWPASSSWSPPVWPLEA